MAKVVRGVDVAEVERLGTLAERANAEHRAVQLAVADALEHALNAGDLLLRAKAAQQHGTWLVWLGDNFEGSVRTAQVYMQLAKRRALVEAAKAQSPALLSIAGAMQHLAPQAFGPEPVPGTVPLPPDQEAEERRRERSEQKLRDRAELALRTGNPEQPADLSVSLATWEHALWQAVQLRQQNIPNVLDALGYELDILVHHAAPEAVGRYLVEPTNDYEEAERRSSMLADLREGLPWLQRVLEEAEAARDHRLVSGEEQES